MDLLNQNKIERKNNKTEHFNILEGSSICFIKLLFLTLDSNEKIRSAVRNYEKYSTAPQDYTC